MDVVELNLSVEPRLYPKYRKRVNTSFIFFFCRARSAPQSCQFVPEARKTNPSIGSEQKRRLIVKRRPGSENEIRITGLSVAGRGRPGSINILSARNVGDGMPSGRFDW